MNNTQEKANELIVNLQISDPEVRKQAQAELCRLIEADTWIPVSERLPDFEGRVLTFRKYDKNTQLVDVDYHHLRIEKGCFGANSHTVTHWKPITPPREE